MTVHLCVNLGLLHGQSTAIQRQPMRPLNLKENKPPTRSTNSYEIGQQLQSEFSFHRQLDPKLEQGALCPQTGNGLKARLSHKIEHSCHGTPR